MSIFPVKLCAADLIQRKGPEIFLKFRGDRGDRLHKCIRILLAEPCLPTVFFLSFRSVFCQTPQKRPCHKCHTGLTCKLRRPIMLQSGPETLHCLHDLMKCSLIMMQQIFFSSPDFLQFSETFHILFQDLFIIQHRIFSHFLQIFHKISSVLFSKSILYQTFCSLLRSKIITGKYNLKFYLIMCCQIMPQCILIIAYQSSSQLLRYFLRNQRVERIFQADIRLISDPVHQIF